MIFWLSCIGKESILETGANLTEEDTEVGFVLDFPLLERELFRQRIGVDHDREAQEGTLGALQCLDYLGRAFPHCYDQHDGSDFILIGGFTTMDEGSAHIIAAAPGTVVRVVDGNYDRCHGSLDGATVSCDGYPMIANSVIIEHEQGYRTLYWHMMNGSVAVSQGQEVLQGDILGKVGSSGYSSMPHLHFELQDEQENVIDPYGGPYSQEQSYWCAQEEPIPQFCE